jgi:hypothetical protein
MAMSNTPVSTVKLVALEPLDDTKVRLKLEVIVDAHRLTEVGSEMLKVSVAHARTGSRIKQKT